MRGPYLRVLKKGLQKRPIGAKTCSDRPISCKKGSKKGVKKGPFGVLYLIVLVNSRFACISSWRSRLQEWFKASETVFSLLGTAEILARPWKKGSKKGSKGPKCTKCAPFRGPFLGVQNRGHILPLL